ncbi:SH3-like domain-containing protein [Agrobacterium vitis]|nr:SH3-like domain-containing protein [Agrobacterium vitis]MBE1439736.1 SH3-like domain-containing protein [Agrobacterium vitis]
MMRFLLCHSRLARPSRVSALLAIITVLGPAAGYTSPAAPQTGASTATAAGPIRQAGRVTGFPLPRYVSIKSGKARMRVGPSADYPIRWVYEAKGLPVEIIEEYGNWRQVRDSDGTTGWMSAVLLSGDRTGLVAPWRSAKGHMVSLRDAPSSMADIVARLQPRVRLDLRMCDSHWCKVAVQNSGPSGYIRQELVWGVYRDEIIAEARL